MEEFYKEVYTTLYRLWILNHQIQHCTISDNGLDEITMTTKYGIGTITFNPFSIIELCVKELQTSKIKFYLHFQMKSLGHATKLFEEMVECLMTLVQKPKRKILLCCSGGLTTSCFALKINETMQVLEMNDEVTATSYTHLFEIGENYDVILLAPQISYLHAKVTQIYRDKIVLKIPSAIFATYDVNQLFSFIGHSKVKAENSHLDISPIVPNGHISFSKKIFCLSLFRDHGQVHIGYRLYGKNKEIILNKEIIKPKITVDDLFDVMDSVMIQHQDIAMIGFSTPGLINDGIASSAGINGFEEMDYGTLFKQRYQCPFMITNDVNNAAIGYHDVSGKYHSLSFVFQPVSTGAGAGIIINDTLIKGKNAVAGEMKYLPSYQKATINGFVNRTPEEIHHQVRDIILDLVSTIGPEAVVLFCSLITHIKELEDELMKYIPKEYLPDLIKVNDLQEYIFHGLWIVCSRTLQKEL